MSSARLARGSMCLGWSTGSVSNAPVFLTEEEAKN